MNHGPPDREFRKYEKKALKGKANGASALYAQRRKPTYLTSLKPSNIKEAINALPFVIKLFGIVYSISPARTIVMLVGSTLNSALPALSLGARGKFIDAVGKAIDHGVINHRRLYKYASLELLAYVLTEGLRWVLTTNNSVLDKKLSRQLDISLMRAHLRLDVAKTRSIEDSEKFKNARAVSAFRPFERIVQSVDIINSITTIVTQGGTMASLMSRRAWILIVLSLANPLVRAYKSLFWSGYYTVQDTNNAYLRMQSFKRFAHDPVLRAEVKLFNLEDYLVEKYEEADEQVGNLESSIKSGTALDEITGSMNVVLQITAYLLVASRPSYFGLSLASLTFLTSAAERIFDSTTRLLQRSENTMQEWFRIKDLFDCLDMMPDMQIADFPIKFEPQVSDAGTGVHIETRSLTFSYPGKAVNVVEDVSFSIEPGQMVAVVGYNGSGKSTLISLLTRLYDATSGQVLINGHDIKDYDPKDLHEHTAVLLQDFARYSGVTIGESIGMGNVADVGDKQRIEEAAKAAGAHDFISKFHSSYDTMLLPSRPMPPPGSNPLANPRIRRSLPTKSEEVDLSGGQWQKLASARLWMRAQSSSFLILDEPSANLDPQAEHDLFQHIRSMRRNKTTLYISHRFHTVRGADKILLMDRGRVVESGTHEELMGIENGRYKHLFELQANAFM